MVTVGIEWSPGLRALQAARHHVLQTPDGNSLRALAQGQSSQFAHVLRHINAKFAERMTIDELARMASTSIPTSHQRFKATTGSSPLQYIKALRLTRARQMLGEGGLVTSAYSRH